MQTERLSQGKARGTFGPLAGAALAWTRLLF